MANEVATLAPKLPTIQAGGQVRAIVPQDFDSAWRIANAVCKAGMAPRGLETAEKAMVAILHGLEIGLTPMNALQSIAVINGRPTIWGDGAIGLVRSSGLLESIEEKVEDRDGDLVATCTVKRKGEGVTVVRSFSKKQAETAGLWTKRGRDGQATPWQTYPDRMLQMRARAFALRDTFADVLKGLSIREEMEDVAAMRDVTPAPEPPMPPAEPEQAPEPPAPPAEDAQSDDIPLSMDRRASLPRRVQALLDEIEKRARACTDLSALAEVDVWQGQQTKGLAVEYREAAAKIIHERQLLLAPPDNAEGGEPPLEPQAFDENDWLRDLVGALTGATDANQALEIRRRVMVPQRGKVSAGIWAQADTAYEAALDRLADGE